MKRIAVIPIDNRPICYTLIEQICAIDGDIKLFLPPREMLGGLTSSSDIEGILNWIDKLEPVDNLIVSLDTIAYGGLVNSRRCDDSFDEILERVLKLEKLIEGKAGKIFAFSSIMRISNNNINEEEKLYWAQWGKRIFEYSYHSHKTRKLKTSNCVNNIVPDEILADYLNTRKRNFEINKHYLQSGVFDTLIFSKDDTGEFGLNVEEAEILAGMGAIVKTGADEIPLTLLARSVTAGRPVSTSLNFLCPGSERKISKYEDIALIDCVKSQLSLAGVEIKPDGDLNFIINNFAYEQGDLVLGEANSFNKADFERNKPYFIADVNNANGADFGFVEELLAGGIDENFYGYCGYNTSANSIGCVICIAVVKFFAQKYNHQAFKKLAMIRFLDDWAYQAKIRRGVRDSTASSSKASYSQLVPKGPGKLVSSEFVPYEEKISKFLNFEHKEINYSLPWNRSFEVEIQI